MDTTSAMDQTDNMTVSLDTMHQNTYDFPSSPTSEFAFGHQQAWSTPSDLSGFIYNIPVSPQETSSGASCRYPIQENRYPSPPPTGSQAKYSVPLPSANGVEHSIFAARSTGGILDSPLVMHNGGLPYHIPLSPPQTLPTPTQDLPETDNDFTPDLPHDPSEVTPSSSPSSPHSCLHAPDVPDERNAALLSPLSPVWESNRISDASSLTSEDSVLLAEPHVVHHDQISPSMYDFYSGFHHTPRMPDNSYTDQLGTCRPFLRLLDIPQSRQTMRPVIAGSSHVWDDPTKMDENAMQIDQVDVAPFSSYVNSFTPPHSDIVVDDELLRYPNSLENYDSAETFALPDLYDDPTNSPSLRSFSSLPELEMDEDPFFSPPSSPGRTLLSLPGADTDDSLLPSSSFSDASYPAIIDPTSSFPHNNSNHSLLLIDDELTDDPIPRSPSPESGFDHDVCAILEEYPDQDLQKLYDLRKRSQQAERLARQEEAILMEEGPLHRRIEARMKRKREKERSKEIGALLRLKLKLGVAGEAEKTEVPLSHAKRGEGVGMDNPTRSRKKIITSMAHLVARMIFRRHEMFPPLPNRKSTAAPSFQLASPRASSRKHTASPLSRSEFNTVDFG